jgi:hypothetical protein
MMFVFHLIVRFVTIGAIAQLLGMLVFVMITYTTGPLSSVSLGIMDESSNLVNTATPALRTITAAGLARVPLMGVHVCARIQITDHPLTVALRGAPLYQCRLLVHPAREGFVITRALVIPRALGASAIIH